MFKEHREIFASKYIWTTTVTNQSHVTSPVTWPFNTPPAISYRFYTYCNRVCISSHFRDYGPQTYWRSQHWPFMVTWSLWSRDHSIRHMPFPVGVPMALSLYLHHFQDIWPPTPVHTHTDTRRKSFYILSHETYHIGQTTNAKVSWRKTTSLVLRHPFPPGSVMVSFERTMVVSFKLSIVTIALSLTVWLQFATECLRCSSQ